MKTIHFYKKLFIGVLLIAPLAIGIFSCHPKHDEPAPDNSAIGTTIVKDSITGNVHWTANQHYLLQNYVYVVSGATLTIDAGTVIKGDKASHGTLIVERGGKIIAQGTAANPIIFTSNQPAGSRNYGDWGGVVLCGKSPNNWIAASGKVNGATVTLGAGTGQVEGGPRSLYGGTDAADNSGTLQYVRIEFGGVALSPNFEINGLTLCSVGTGTTIDHIQVSYSGDDSYEWFGGTVNCKYLICHRGWDDDFDMDNGYQGSVQFGMILRDPYAADGSGSHSFECDSRNENSTGILTKPVFSNITAVGPLVNPVSTSYNPNYVCGAIMRRAGAVSIMNSLIIGYPSGIIIEDDATYGLTTSSIQDSTLQVMNTAIIGMPTIGQALLFHKNDGHSAPNAITAASDADTTTGTPFGSSAGPYTWAIALKNKIYSTEGTSSKLLNAFSLTTPDFIPATSSVVYSVPPALPSMKASFSSSKFTGNLFFDQTAKYVGAFNNTSSAADDWTSGWANFDPQNANYGSAY